jgi:SOS-response transcriptional repressor LexA
VPILTWKESINWKKHIKEDRQAVTTDIQISSNAYALNIDEDLDDGFRKNSIIIVDPEIKPSDKDYIISYKGDAKTPLLKRLQKYEGSLYLKPLVSGIPPTLFTEEYRVLGVVRQIKLTFNN